MSREFVSNGVRVRVRVMTFMSLGRVEDDEIMDRQPVQLLQADSSIKDGVKENKDFESLQLFQQVFPILNSLMS